MFKCELSDDLGMKWLRVSGRIDSLNAPQLHGEVTQLIAAGEHSLVLDLHSVSYISSAGLRVFVDAYRRLNKIGGEVFFYTIPENVQHVFELSNLTGIFRLVATRAELEQLVRGQTASVPSVSTEIEGISIEYLQREAVPGELVVLGAQERLSTSSYTESDVVTVHSDRFQFGIGLATLGEEYEEYRRLFGEALTVQGNFFFYPAVTRPAVDFMLCSPGGHRFEYKYLHGLGFNGEYRYLFSFEKNDGFVPLTDLVTVSLGISRANLFGIVLVAESKGFWGMNLKRVPTAENRPANGKEIFDQDNFSEWVNFPVEPGEIGNIIVATGIVARDKGKASIEVQKLMAEGKDFHLHAGVFAKEPLSKRIETFEAELTRVTGELSVHKVQHALGQSCFSRGMAGIIELRG